MSNKTCPTCNQEIYSKNNYCPNCGTPVSKKALEKNQSKPKSSKSNSTRDTFIVIGALVVIVAGYLIYTTLSKENQVQTQKQQQQQEFDHPDVGEDMASLLNTEFPTDYNNLVQYGNQLMDQGNYTMAAESYKRALKIDGSSNDVRTDYGACLHGMRLNDRALEEFYTVIANDKNHGIAHFNIGIVYYNMNQTDSAKYYWEKYLSIDPNGQAAAVAKQKLQELGG